MGAYRSDRCHVGSVDEEWSPHDAKRHRAKQRVDKEKESPARPSQRFMDERMTAEMCLILLLRAVM